MKILGGHYDAMKSAVNDVIDSYGKQAIVENYEKGNFPHSDKVKDLQKRLCFDLLHAANIGELVSEICEYANDSHIYTALKAICPTVIKRY